MRLVIGFLFAAFAFAQTGAINIINGTVNLSTAGHTLTVKVVANTGALPATCTTGELAMVTAATLGQQLYQCSAGNVWTQQLNSGTATGGGITMYSATGLTVTANTYYLPVGGGASISTTEANVNIDSPAAATITNMYVQLSVALGVGNSGVFTMRKAGVSQSVTCTITGGSATSCSDTTHSFNVSQGDLLSIQLVTTGTIVVTPNILIASQFGNITATGTVNTGTANQIAYYAGNGSAVSGTNAIPNGTTATTQTTGDATTQVANDAFVAGVVASINPAVSVQAATIAVLSNTPTYSNGTAGVGATLTAASNGALTIDGYTVLLNDRILVKNQASTFQNGIYTETTLGTGSVPYVLTRATDYNATTNINYTGTIPVLQGSTLSNTGWNGPTNIVTVGTDAITYTQAASGNSGGPPGGNVKATGNLTSGHAITGAGGKTIQDSGIVYGAVRLPTPGSTCTFSGGSTICVCTTTCTVTVPAPAAGYQFCAMNDDNVSTVITLSAIGSSGQYENQARTAYGTATTGTLVSGGALKDFVCILGRDSTHYLFASGSGTWTAN